MNCWICGADAKTGEHKLKASDLKSEFGEVSQQKPIYFNSANIRNLKVSSIKNSTILKYTAKICAQCNNARTSDADKAWGKLSAYLRARKNLHVNSIICIEKVFPGTTKISMLHVHLFFIKQFGCAIKELSIPIDIQGFSEAILNNKPHPKVHISIGASNGIESGSTDVETASIQGKCVFAAWMYTIGSITINIMYAEPHERRKGLKNSWHPNSVTKRMKLVKY